MVVGWGGWLSEKTLKCDDSSKCRLFGLCKVLPIMCAPRRWHTLRLIHSVMTLTAAGVLGGTHHEVVTQSRITDTPGKELIMNLDH